LPLFRKEVLQSSEDRLHGEVVFTQPLSTKLLAGAFFAILAIAGIWVTFGTYARIEMVPGRLITDTPTAKVMAPQSGIVSDLLVTEGQFVDRHTPLLVIDSDREASDGGDVAERNLRVISQRIGLAHDQVKLVSDKARTDRARLLSVMQSAEQSAVSLRKQIEIQQQVVRSNREIFDRLSEVVERGFVSKIEFERRRQTLLSAQQSLTILEERLATSIEDAAQARSQLDRNTIDAAQSISQLRSTIQALAGEEARLQGERSYVIKAPIAGRVTALATGAGRSVHLNRPMLTIVPDDAALTADLYAPTRAIGFVEPGKETRLLYDAFPYQRFGSFTGRVASVSRVAVDPRETDIPFPFEEPVYRVKVALEQQSVEAFGEDVPLQAGMTLQANIVLERQSFLAWLLQPLNAVLNRSS